jgi:hypothetical protein
VDAAPTVEKAPDVQPQPSAREPASPPSRSAYVYAPGDIYPRNDRERQLCDQASNLDWIYLTGLLLLDTGAIWLGSSSVVKFADSIEARLSGPAMIGLTWGATLGGSWLALPKCSPQWVETPPREGDVHATWPLALSIALLAGATAPIVNGIAVGNLPVQWTTEEREAHVAVAAVFGFAGALLPYVLPPRTVAAARELERIRVAPLLGDGQGQGTVGPGLAAGNGGGRGGRGGAYIGYSLPF